jgi:hypothetical protein
MSLEEHFNSVNPREDSGAPVSDRFQYQKDWALCHLLRLHADNVDYLMAFDIHDDVVIFQPEQSPNKICFYQVKTKKTGETWTKGKLIERPKGKDGNPLPSIVGKMYSNVLLFADYAQCSTFLSNVPCKLELSPDGKQAVLLSDVRTPFENLPKKYRTDISEAVKQEHLLTADPILEKMLWFELSELPLEGHSTHTKGKLAEFLEARKPGKYNTPLAYKTLSDELKRRNDYNRRNLRFSEMVKFKAIGRSEFEKILSVAVPDETAENTWPEVAAHLLDEQFGLQKTLKLKKAWFKVDMYRSDASDSAFWETAEVAASIVPNHSDLKHLLSDGLEDLKNKIACSVKFEDDMLRAVLLFQLFCS